MEEDRALEIIRRLKLEYPGARTSLRYSNPLELLIAVILSAQCTDETVNKVTDRLFEKYRSAEDYASSRLAELEEDIRSTGFFRNKARNIKESAGLILTKFGGEVPKTMDELLELPGVARKTANIVLGNAYGVVRGIAVDTHVKRLSRRLGLTENENPDKIERDLMAVLSADYWFEVTYLLIEHGRAVCKARKPRCDACVLADICPSAFRAG